MAEIQEPMPMKQEREIPVFTVLKSDCILKNIFLLDNLPSVYSSPSPPVAEVADRESEIEVMLVVGRHPDCNIKLEHPSISRFHLRIHSKPSSRSLFVTDLSSVHGTWVSGRRIEPGVRVKVNEGDTLHLGASSRLYRLNWVPLSRAYEIENPFVPQQDAHDTMDEGVTDQDQDSVCCRKNQGQGPNDDGEGLSNEDIGLTMQKLSPIAPPMPENLNHPSFDENEVEENGSPEIYNKENEISISQCHLDASFTVDEETIGTTDQGGNSLHSGNDEQQGLSDDMEGLDWLFSDENLTVSQAEATEYSGMKSEKRSAISIWSRRGKPNRLEIQRRKSCAGINMSSQVESLLDGNFSSESMLKDKYESPDSTDENCTPDKENTPPKDNVTLDSHLLNSMKSFGKFPIPYRPSPLVIACRSMYEEKVLDPTLHKAIQEWKSAISISRSHDSLKKNQPESKAIADREPLYHPLLVNSTPEAESIPCRESEDVNQPHKNTMKVRSNRWIIIADTTTLLNRKSRMELQLLRGLPGTTLVIPRIVVRELVRMLKRASLFSKTTEISTALNWMEECMAETKWWVHVQSSAEEDRLVPPTPPSSSPRWFSEEKSIFSVGSNPFSLYGLQEIVTPTAADHILECALWFKRTTYGQLVLLSDDVILKIKAMAEGVICETAEEFRRSIVNPFSPRFLYSNSSPIGPTWSCFDDTVLKEKYYPSPSKKTSKSAKGLKLILLHNSNFSQMTN